MCLRVFKWTAWFDEWRREDKKPSHNSIKRWHLRHHILWKKSQSESSVRRLSHKQHRLWLTDGTTTTTATLWQKQEQSKSQQQTLLREHNDHDCADAQRNLQQVPPEEHSVCVVQNNSDAEWCWIRWSRASGGRWGRLQGYLNLQNLVALEPKNPHDKLKMQS